MLPWICFSVNVENVGECCKAQLVCIDQRISMLLLLLDEPIGDRMGVTEQHCKQHLGSFLYAVVNTIFKTGSVGK